MLSSASTAAQTVLRFCAHTKKRETKSKENALSAVKNHYLICYFPCSLLSPFVGEEAEEEEK